MRSKIAEPWPEVRIAACKSAAFAAIRKGGGNFIHSKISEPCPRKIPPEFMRGSPAGLTGGENRRLQKRSFCGGSQGRKEFYAQQNS